MAMSAFASAPRTRPAYLPPPVVLTVTVAPACPTTWALVTASPSALMMKPDPALSDENI